MFKTLRWEDYLRLPEWVQSNHMNPEKKRIFSGWKQRERWQGRKTDERQQKGSRIPRVRRSQGATAGSETQGPRADTGERLVGEPAERSEDPGSTTTWN